MILSKDSNNNWIPTAGGTGTFIGTAAAFNAVKATLPVNTVAYITDDGNGDLQPVDAVTNGDMHPVTSNAVYDALVSSTIRKLSNLGDNYALDPTDFSGKVTRHIASFTNATSPNVQAESDPSDSGDWDVYNLYHGSSNFCILIAVSPRKNYRIYFNFFWEGIPSGWKVLTIS